MSIDHTHNPRPSTLREFYNTINISLYDNQELIIPSCFDCKRKDTISICLKCGVFKCREHSQQHSKECIDHYLSISYTMDQIERNPSIYCHQCEAIIDYDSNDSGINDIKDLINAMKLFNYFDKRNKYTIHPLGADEHQQKEEAQVYLKEKSLNGIAEYINSGRCKNIVVLTGAGISVASGIPDFRSPTTGIYNNPMIAKLNMPFKEAIFDIDYFHVHPEHFYTLSKEMIIKSYQPTQVHKFIKLLQDKSILLRNYSQNIDTLERVVGIDQDKLIEAHGTFASAHCLKCDHSYSMDYVKEIVGNDQVPRCTKSACEGVIKPDVVFFGDALPPQFNRALLDDYEKMDLLIVIGTSLKVLPICSMITFHPTNKPTIPRLLINLEEVGSDDFGGFQFTNPKSNDVLWIGDCQQGVLELSKLLN